jgi:hypothetical protein
MSPQFEIVGASIPSLLPLPTDIVGFKSKEAAEVYAKANGIESYKEIRESRISIITVDHVDCIQ